MTKWINEHVWFITVNNDKTEIHIKRGIVLSVFTDSNGTTNYNIRDIYNHSYKTNKIYSTLNDARKVIASGHQTTGVVVQQHASIISVQDKPKVSVTPYNFPTGMFWTTSAMKSKLLADDKWLMFGLKKLATNTKLGKRDKMGFGKYDIATGMDLYYASMSPQPLSNLQMRVIKRIVVKYAKQLANFANTKIEQRLGYNNESK